MTHLIYHFQQAIQHAAVVRDRIHELRPHEAYLHMLDEDMKAINANYIDFLEALKQHTKAQLEALNQEGTDEPF